MKRHAGFVAVAPILFTTAVVLGACGIGPDLEFADWTLPVPEGTPVSEYAAVPMADRIGHTMDLVEDLVIGGDEHSMFYQAPEIAVAEDGTMYILDEGNHRVQMFRDSGEFIRSFGQEGQGPGEMQSPQAITIAGGHLLIADGFGATRLSTWTFAGEHIADHQAQESFGLFTAGLPDGTFVDSGLGRAEDRSSRLIVARYSSTGEELRRYADVPGPLPATPPARGDRGAMIQMLIDSTAMSSIKVVVASGERIYLSMASEYQALAISLEGELLWALRVAWPAPPYAEWKKESHTERAKERDVDPSSLRFPERDPALLAVRVDGHGRLHVFPDSGELTGDDPAYPVDVYSPDGELLFAGISSGASWETARGDYVYGRRLDRETDEWHIVRYRIVLNED